MNVEFFFVIYSDLLGRSFVRFSSKRASVIFETLHWVSLIYITYPSKMK